MNATQKVWTLFESSSTGVGTPLTVTPDKCGMSIDIQVYGDAGTTFAGKFKAKVFADGGYEEISLQNKKTMAWSPDFTAYGIYTVNLGAILQLEVDIASISVGELIVKAKIYN